MKSVPTRRSHKTRHGKPLIVAIGETAALLADPARTLSGQDFLLRVVPAGTDPAEALESWQPDLVLIDLGGGKAAGERGHRLPGWLETIDHLPVLTIGSATDRHVIEWLRRMPMSDFIGAPVDEDLLIRKIHQLLQAARDRDELSLCRARLAHTQRIAGLGSWEWHPEGNTLWWSGEVYRIFGQEEGRFAPSYSAFLSAIHAADREAVHHTLQGALSRGLPLDVGFRIVRSDGRLRFLHAQGELVSLGVGRPTVMFGTLQDITERRESEHQLRLLKEAVECLPVGITITGVDGGILFVNPAEAKLHGYEVEELLHRKSSILAPSRLRAPLCVEKIEELGVWRRESVNLRKSGDEFPVQLSSISVRNPDGDFLGVITTCEDISERKANEQRIVELAYHDTLTGLPNRWMFHDRLNKALAVAGRSGSRVGLMFLDLDHFKDVNDSLGHEFGDRLLRAVAQRLAASTREADTLARLGGDEFVVILTNPDDQNGVAAAAERIQAALRDPFELDGRQIYSGASIGIAIHPEDGRDAASLLQSADLAMYHAKEQGRQTYHFYSPEMNRSIRRKVSLESGLRQALDREEIRLVLQPQWDLGSGALVGLEALLRWESAEFGLVPPGHFIPLAESSGLIHSIGEWAMRNACARVAAWLTGGMDVPKLAVNISGRQLQRPDFLSMVDAILRETGLPPQKLELEISESSLMEDVGRTVGILQELNARGASLCIDNFGAGYSSLSNLRHLPVGRIKIDCSLIADVAKSPEGEAIVEAIITLGHSLGLKVLAEGVESREQVEFLRHRGCDEAQGFFLARPLSAEEAASVLSSKGPPSLIG